MKDLKVNLHAPFPDMTVVKDLPSPKQILWPKSNFEDPKPWFLWVLSSVGFLEPLYLLSFQTSLRCDLNALLALMDVVKVKFCQF